VVIAQENLRQAPPVMDDFFGANFYSVRWYITEEEEGSCYLHPVAKGN